MNTIEDYGWDSWFEGHFAQHRSAGLVPARITRDTGPGFEVHSGDGMLAAEIRGKMRHTAQSRGELPVIGDWVAVRLVPGERKAVIDSVLPRKNSFARKEAGAKDRRRGGKTEEQVLTANVDTAFIVCGLDGYRSFNIRKVERYIAMSLSSGAAPVVLLNKIDLCPEYQEHVAEVQALAPGIPAYPVSALQRIGLEAIEPHLEAGKTGVFLGPSGVGKTALLNALMGGAQLETGEVRQSDGKGRHTTSHRQMEVLPWGGLIIDTPGMRELAVWTDEHGIGMTFGDVESIASLCKFKDCRHEAEPGCAIKKALADGTLDPGRWHGYLKLQREAAFLQRRKDARLRLEDRKKWKKISILSKQIKKGRWG